MRIQRYITKPFPVLLLEPNVENANQLAPRLEAAGFDVRVETCSLSAFQALRKSFFFALVVIADLADQDCLVTLATLRRKAPRSWMIVVASRCDIRTCDLIHRHGGDACVAVPISVDDLIDRLDAFQLRARPSF
jgi:DNA-binding response OmpR family regulator